MSAEALEKEEPLEVDASVESAPAAELVAETPTAPPSPSSEVPSDLDSLLEQFDREIGSQTSPQAPTDGIGQQDELESLLSQLGEQQRRADGLGDQYTKSTIENGQLQSERDGWKGVAERSNQMLQEVQRHLWLENESRDFGRFSSEVQARLPDHVPADYADAWLRRAATMDQTLAVAWDARNANPMAIQVEIDRTQRIMAYIMANPAADHSKLPKLPELEEYWRKLNIAGRSKDILAQARGACIAEARKSKPIDEEVTADVAAVAHYVRSAGNGKMPAERAPNLGQMSDRELKDYTRQFGF